jgi:hypothetical protein
MFMDRSVWAIAALFYAAGALSVVIVFEIFGGSQSSQPATTIVAVPGKTASTVEVVSKRPQPSFQNAQRAVIRTLKDPASAQFGRTFDGLLFGPCAPWRAPARSGIKSLYFRQCVRAILENPNCPPVR